MRWAVAILGLCLGLIVALPFGVRMSHLRAIVPDAQLPDRAAWITDDSRIVAGRMIDPDRALAAEWSAHAAWPPQSDLRLEGAGLALRGDIVWVPDNAVVTLDGITGQIDLSVMGGADLPRLGGQISITAGAGDIAIRDGRLRRIAGQVQGTALTLDGITLGNVDMQVLPEGIGWRAPFTLTGPILQGRGTAEGRYAEPLIFVTLDLRRVGDEVPAPLARALDLAGTATPNGWTVQTRFDARRLLAGMP